jgi:hypothetical protein
MVPFGTKVRSFGVPERDIYIRPKSESDMTTTRASTQSHCRYWEIPLLRYALEAPEVCTVLLHDSQCAQEHHKAQE